MTPAYKMLGMLPLRCTRKPLDPIWVDQEASVIGKTLSSLDGVEEIFWFGSSAEGKMTDQSDFDFLLVVAASEQIRPAQKQLRSLLPLSRYPVDIVWVERSRFDKMKRMGGVCLIAFEDGRKIFQKGKPLP